ncbi:hypothetical protein GCM10027060_02560 [Nesterenkonia halophila]|uniref:class I SAM-dependent methyltransferase n=1 Tax=Nesterenkonia halophila TaxID=302044 RepID=UPI0012909EB0|nr:methyltransferase [Nesterenkonia halophila]
MSRALEPGRTPEVVPSRLTAAPQDGGALDRARLRRRPDDGEQAYDAADLLLLDTAAAWWAAGHPTDGVVVLDDRWGALTLPLVAAGHTVRTAQDARGGELALAENAAALDLPAPAPRPVDADTVAGARTVLMPLPRSLDALADWAHLAAEHAAEDVVLLAGGRDKHMTRSMNEVLEQHFADVVPGRGRSKSRVLTARSPRRGLAAPGPRRAVHAVAPVDELTLCSTGTTYGGTSVDPGTRRLLAAVDGHAAFEAELAAADRLVDLGCGNGTVAAWAARRRPQVQVLAVDDSASATASTTLTAEANAVADRVEVRRADELEDVAADGGERLILLNPPFHRGNAVDPTAAHRLIASAGRALAPGGTLYCVWNSHLQHRAALRRFVGPTRQLARDRKFTVTVSEKPAG